MAAVTTGPAFISSLERFGAVGSTNDIARERLAAGTPEVCVAVADEQTTGRGRNGRTWTAPPGAALLVSLGFRPAWLAPDRTWRLGAIVALAMADAAEEVGGLRDDAIRLKWPNDLVTVDGDAVRKLAGVLGETDGLGGPDPRAVIGIGVNADWPAVAFPAELRGSMTSLREASGGRPIDREALLAGFLGRLEARVETLRDGRFDSAGWTARQATNGRDVTIARADGSTETAHALGVDPATGALLVADADAPRGERAILSGEVVRLRLAPAGTV